MLLIVTLLSLILQSKSLPFNYFESTPAVISSSSNYVSGYPRFNVFSRPGEIVFKLYQDWEPEEYLNPTSAGFKILEGNIRRAIQRVLGESAIVSGVSFSEDYTSGSPVARPKTMVHLSVNGGSDSAAILANAVQPDSTMGDGLKVYKESFRAY